MDRLSPHWAFFVYQEMFCCHHPALITGAFADRVNFKSYLVFLIFWSFLVYIPWLTGFGEAVSCKKWVRLILPEVWWCTSVPVLPPWLPVFIVGKRKILPTEKTQPHNITYVALGTGLLWFGWFGFNGGSALAANGIAAIAFVNTDIAGSLA